MYTSIRSSHTPPTLRWMVWLLLTSGGVIVTKLAYLQIKHAPLLLARSKKNYLRTETVPTPRGNIFDRYGMLLATSRPLISLVWQGTGNRWLSAEQQADIDRLEADIMRGSLARQEVARYERQRRSMVVQSDITFEQLSRVLELFPEHPNIQLQTSFQRFYPHHTLACHVLGYIGDLSVNQTGVMGLEKAYEATLRGTQGRLLKTINSLGYLLSSESVHDGSPGTDIQTTLDIELQQLAERSFPAEYEGTMIVMDAATGALRVVVSRPSFDPNLFVKPIDSLTWTQLTSQSCFINRAFSACYPPASLFKLVTLLAGLSNNLIGTQETWCCSGYTIFGGRRYHCNNRVAHGVVNIPAALAQSCNTPFFDIGRKVRINTLAHYAQLLGLGLVSNTLFNEKKGIIPTTQWKWATYKEPWWPGETLSVAIGQGFLLATPVQLCVMVNTICQGCMVTPHLTLEHEVPPRAVAIKPEHLTFIKDLMRQVVMGSRGTGHQLHKLHDMRIYAKTGTAQTCALKADGPTRKEEIPHGWFTAHVEYKNYEAITMIVFVEHAGSSKVAADITKGFLNQYRRIMDRREER